MLAKLFKHEMVALGRQLLPMYGILILITCINKLGMLIDIDMMYFNTLRVMFATAYVLGIVALFFACWIIIILRFYKSLLSSEGYLSFTLPVSANGHIFVKLVAAVIMAIVSAAVAILSIFILGAGTSTLNTNLDKIAYTFKQLFEIFGGNFILYIIEIIIVILVTIVQSFLMFYASMALGQLFGKNRVLGAFVSYFVIYLILQIITTAIFTIIYFVSPNFLTLRLSFQQGVMVTHIALLSITVFYCILSLIYYLITRFVLTRKLNLE